MTDKLCYSIDEVCKITGLRAPPRPGRHQKPPPQGPPPRPALFRHGERGGIDGLPGKPPDGSMIAAGHSHARGANNPSACLERGLPARRRDDKLPRCRP